jgi:hypothetical protein
LLDVLDVPYVLFSSGPPSALSSGPTTTAAAAARWLEAVKEAIFSFRPLSQWNNEGIHRTNGTETGYKIAKEKQRGSLIDSATLDTSLIDFSLKLILSLVVYENNQLIIMRCFYVHNLS